MTSRDDCRCTEVLARLFALLDSELDAAEAARLEHHVASCPDCSSAAEAESHLRAVLRRCCQEHAPETLRTRVITQISVMRLQQTVIRSTDLS